MLYEYVSSFTIHKRKYIAVKTDLNNKRCNIGYFTANTELPSMVSTE